MSTLTPQEIVNELDKNIVGQHQAKRSVAIALRNRDRRMKVTNELRNEITPKNILMIGPTGVGKTEVARRLAKLAKAPFIKVEATKFTEIGYVGRDVDSIVRDLADYAMKMVRAEKISQVQDQALIAAEERIINELLPEINSSPSSKDTKDMIMKKFKNGELDNKEIEINVPVNAVGIEIMAPPGMEEMTQQLQGLFQSISNEKKQRKKMKVSEAFKALQEEEAARLLNEDEIRAAAVERVEQTGIVFLDEIDKVTHRSEQRGGEVSREGVQRDLLPLIEGCTVSTKYGSIKTDHILFIASGAFHLAKPSDLIPELQGRLPIRVELNALKTEDFIKILTEPRSSLIKQYIALMATESVSLEFADTAIKRLAEISWTINERTENIGARRLHTIMEKLLEDISFSASEKSGESLLIDEEYVNNKLGSLVKDDDLSRFIL